ncbi:acyltransferase [Arthrobacter sp. efr-133-R2A-63]|uniref:acyltransferase family protein n=1 Tax=Arthrobacter sp. efr-133-R2A-63 TaxID=3040278 RepID=UPI00254B3B2B|nr:acyltransferase [Arthrobacter sp. efr-133-R2A-63]
MDQQRKESSLGYVPALDGLRGIAILLVLAHHAYGAWDAGSVGVDVFFVLSGYLITTILLKELDRSGRISLWHFYLRRLFRLYPALLVVILAVAALTPIVGSNWIALFAAGTYTTNIGTVFLHLDLGPLKHTWSLAQEEQFYLIWPLFLIIASRFQMPRKAQFLVTVLASSGCIALFVVATGSGTATLNPIARMGGIAAGCVVALALNTGIIRTVRAWLMWAGAGVGICAIIMNSTGLVDAAILAPVVILGCLPLLAGLMAGPGGAIASILSCPPLVYIGVISYSLYLWHYPLFYFAQSLHLGTWLTAAIALPVSFGLAALSRRFIEVPGMALGVSRVKLRTSPRNTEKAGAPV